MKPNSLLVRVLKEKYFPDRSFLDSKQGRRSSWGWKGIIQGRKLLERGLRWRVGDRRSTRVKTEP